MTTPSEIGSATVQVWARKRKARAADLDDRFFSMLARNDAINKALGPPKPWIQDAIRKWWKGGEGTT